MVIAEEEGTHLLDLHRASIEYVEAIGPDAAHRLNRSPDDTTRASLPCSACLRGSHRRLVRSCIDVINRLERERNDRLRTVSRLPFWHALRS